MYSLDTPLDTLQGIGPKLSAIFAEKEITTLKDLLFYLPIRYSDRSEITTIADLEVDKLVSFPATITKPSSFYKNRRKISSAFAIDTSGRVKLMWFNNKFIENSVSPGATYMVSGKLNSRNTIVQPTLEKISDEDITGVDDIISESDKETIHTGRLVPIYSSTVKIKQGNLRRILKRALEQYELSKRDSFTEIPNQIDLKSALKSLHFPESEKDILEARERLALEELLALIQQSEEIKKYWRSLQTAQPITIQDPKIPNSIPFELTNAQNRCIDEILTDINSANPMNRVLIGDVGSGKTVVAGTAALHTILSGHSVALIAPTKILASQHKQTLTDIFPQLSFKLLTGASKIVQKDTKSPTVYIGTHAVINKLSDINPGLVIYDEQHRFGVNQRSESSQLKKIPHTLTMSATPIPRSLMLTIFSHLQVSMIDELPKGRKPTKTWLLPDKKRTNSYQWIVDQLSESNSEKKLVLVVCPFIDPSHHEAFENVANVTETYEQIKEAFTKLSGKNKIKVEMLHGRMKKEEQEKIIAKTYDNKVDILVTTPIVEVGVDLPTASIIVIEAAERFGMASLHQLRGRVGRAGQQGYCMLFTTSKSKTVSERLKAFSKENNGLKLAELDLKNRGGGDIFGVTQSGFSNLQFASWTNMELIAQAQATFKELPKSWVPIIPIKTNADSPITPLAN